MIGKATLKHFFLEKEHDRVRLQAANKATLKQYFLEKEHDRVRLQVANFELDTIFIPISEWYDEWKIQGKVVEIYRDVLLITKTSSKIVKKTPDSQQAKSRRLLHVFLCHSSGDKLSVRQLCRSLKACNVDPWLDEEKLLPGQHWELEIRKAIKAADVVIVCLSRSAINKTGFVQKEIKFALDVADEQPEGTIFIIPLKLEECEIPERLNHLQWINYSEDDAFHKLVSSLKLKSLSFTQILAPVILREEHA
jgi:hypothetical protein